MANHPMRRGTIVERMLLAFAILLVTAPLWAAPALSPEQQAKWNRIWEEQQGNRLIAAFSGEYRPRTLAIVGVNVVRRSPLTHPVEPEPVSGVPDAWRNDPS